MRVHHIGYLVKNIEKSIHLFEKIGYTIERNVIYDELRNVDICFMINGTERIELVSPRGDSAVGQLRKKIGNAPYHICYETENMDKEIELLRSNQFVIWQEPSEAPAIDGQRVAFLMNSQIGLIEILETNHNK